MDDLAPSTRMATTLIDALGPPPGVDFPWQLVLENTIVGISYMRNRRFVWANARMAEIFDYQPGELDGAPVRRLYVDQQDYDAVGALMAASLSTDGYITHERLLACRNGRLIWCRMSGRLLESGNLEGPSVWVVQDLNDKKQAEDALRRINQRLEQTVAQRTLNLQRTNSALNAEIERSRTLQAAVVASREKYRALFRHMPLGVLVLHADGSLAEYNRALQRFLGAHSRSRLESLVTDPSRVVLGDGRTLSLLALTRDLASGAPRVEHLEFSWIAPNGQRRELSTIAAPLATAQGIVLTVADISEQQRQREREHEQQAALAHASRLSLIGQMASALAHELGQPLNASQSYLSGLHHRLKVAPPELDTLLPVLEKAMRHLEQAGQIIRNVRGFVSRQPPVIEVVALDALLDQTLQLLERPIRASGTRITVDLDGDPGDPAEGTDDAHCAHDAHTAHTAHEAHEAHKAHDADKADDVAEADLAADGGGRPRAVIRVRGNPVEIQQVLVNLLVNALEAMTETPPARRIIAVTVGRAGTDRIQVEVADSGPGVDAEVAPRVFDPYVTTKASGLGMGLMISRTIVEAHGGALALTRGHLGGAAFRFTLPGWPS